MGDEHISRRLLTKGAAKAALALAVCYALAKAFGGSSLLIWAGWIYAVLAIVTPQFMLRAVTRRRLSGLMAGKLTRE